MKKRKIFTKDAAYNAYIGGSLKNKFRMDYFLHKQFLHHLLASPLF